MGLSGLRIEDLELYVAVVESSSIAAAAERLETTSSTVSRRLQKIEACLNVRLLERTTRSQQITSAGEAFYNQCQLTLEQMETLSGQLSEQRELPEGHISVYAPSELFSYLVRELTEEFIRRYPKVRVEFLSGAVRRHLLEDNIDVMVQIDDPRDSSYVARKITTATTSFYASPDYLQRRGEPRDPVELPFHDCVVEISQERVPRPWQFRQQDAVSTIRVKHRYSSDSISLCQALAEQGLGITVLPDFIARDAATAGRLVRLFSEESSVSHNIYAIYASRQFVPAKIRTFVDFLAENLPGKI